MNRIYTIAFATCLFVFTSASQGQTAIGIKAGLNFPTWSGDGAPSSGKASLLGFNAGLVFNLEQTDLFSFQPEIIYTQKGAKYNFSGGSTQLKANYLELPLLAKFTIGTKTLKGFVNAGPAVGYWMSGESKVKAGSTEVTTSIDFNDSHNRLDFSAALGGGLMIAPDKGNPLSIEVRYGLSFLSIFEDTDSSADDVFNRVLSVSLSYMLFGGN